MKTDGLHGQVNGDFSTTRCISLLSEVLLQKKIQITMAPLLLLPFLLILIPSSAQAQATITLGSSLTTQGPNTSWLSPSGEFAFGFRQVEGNSSAYFLAVWFHKISSQTVAWYAKTNDEEPVQVLSGSSLLLTSPAGALSLQDSTGAEVWNPNFVGAVYATMLDTGSFALVRAGGTKIWETFDNPADTILLTQELTPGMTLRSRIIPTDYSSGRFQLNMNRDSVALHRVAVPSAYDYGSYWSMNGNITDLVLDATGMLYVGVNSTQINITYAPIRSVADYYHRATLDPDGAFRQYVYPKKASNQSNQAWSVVGMVPDNICGATLNVGSGTCGFNSYCMLDSTNNQSTCLCPPQYSFIDEDRKYEGCKPDFLPQSCELDEEAASKQFELKPMNKVDWPLADYEQNTPVSKDDCQKLCLTDCFCAVAVYQDSSRTCWRKKMPLSNGNMGNSVDRTLFVKVSKNNSSQSGVKDSIKWKKDKKYWILGSSLFMGSSFLVILLLICVIFFGTHSTVTKKRVPTLQSSNRIGLPLKVFTYEELKDATNGFKEVVGTGASGIVYKGQLQDEHRTFIAVKKIDKLEHETEREFTIEVQTIGRTHHKNLVTLLGFCNEGKERLLVYEFMTNGSLNSFLFGDVARLPWSLRAQLALGVARGLLYLHEECSTQIIHCDIKPQNILLDENFTAKISDFGLAKLLRTKQTQTNTGIRGTRGYVAPEWFKSIGITAKVDVYSFGVILLELICCRRNVEMDVVDEDQKILTYWAMDCYRCGRVDFLVVGDEEATMNLKKVERLVEVALWCLQEDPAIRPTMRMVTHMLDGTAAIPTPPDPSSFVTSLQ